MRTATTIAKGAGDKWVLISGPDTPADKQRAAFNDIGSNWPKEFSEVRFQLGDGPFKIKIRSKAIGQSEQIKNAEKRVAEKAELSKKREAELKASAEKEAKEKADADAKANAKLIANKESAKAKLISEVQGKKESNKHTN